MSIAISLYFHSRHCNEPSVNPEINSSTPQPSFEGTRRRVSWIKSRCTALTVATVCAFHFAFYHDPVRPSLVYQACISILESSLPVGSVRSCKCCVNQLSVHSNERLVPATRQPQVAKCRKGSQRLSLPRKGWQPRRDRKLHSKEALAGKRSRQLTRGA